MSTADQPGVYADGYDSKRPLAGTEDYHLVTIADAGHYDINEIRFFYSPIARRYFWYADTGCECCSHWGFHLDRAGEMESGDRRDALRALDQWCTEEGELWDWKRSAVEILGYQEPPAPEDDPFPSIYVGYSTPRISGTEGFLYVTTWVENNGTNWAAVGILYSPSSQLFYWLDNHGSDWNWGTGAVSVADMEHGDADAAMAALRSAYVARVKTFRANEETYLDAAMELQYFEPPA